MLKLKYLCFYCILTSFLSITSCTHYQPLLPAAEMQRFTDDEFKNYFLKRLDDVIFVQVFSARYPVLKKVSDGFTARDLRIGTVPGIIGKHTPLFNQYKQEYELLKEELVKRSRDKNLFLLEETMNKAEGLLKEHLDSIYSQIDSVIGSEFNMQYNSQGIIDVKRLYEISRHQGESMGNLVDMLFERRYE